MKLLRVKKIFVENSIKPKNIGAPCRQDILLPAIHKEIFPQSSREN